MKTALVSLLSATLIGFVSVINGRSFDAADFIAIAFAVGLAAWTFAQYSRTPRPLTYAKPIHLTVSSQTRQVSRPARQLAA